VSPITVITGAAGALGSALASSLVARGHRIAAVDVPQAAARLAELASSLGGSCEVFPMDISDPAAWAEALPRLASSLGQPTGAALVAGGWRGGPGVHEAGSEDAFHAMVRMNLDTAFQTLHALLPGMVAQGNGSVVVVGSRAVDRPWTSGGAAAYAASKAGVVALAQAAAAEVLGKGVRINAVLPSVIDTPANRRDMPAADPALWVSPASLSAVIAFLLSDDAIDISGAAIPVYGKS
jgi:NAD(P)-dependent dehydrogenase (short-subunit alcohol dehydrogenase family)